MFRERIVVSVYVRIFFSCLSNSKYRELVSVFSVKWEVLNSKPIVNRGDRVGLP